MVLERISVVAALALAMSCGGSSSKGSVDAPVDTPDAAELRTVTGTVNLRFVEPSGDGTLPLNLTGLQVSAIVPPSFTVFPGTAGTDGTFSIPAVP